MAPYGPRDDERIAPESAKQSYVSGQSEPHRGPFARDRARILHSSALRRLAAKTQVVVPMEDDFPRTRLTHSLEVAQIAREMGGALGADADITDAAGLAHDLGHPPFGHNGEEALDSVAGPCGGFEGNAQTLRVLTRLEAKVECDGDSVGLNLTRAVLDAACKYPWPAGPGVRKYGYYADDAPVFEWMRQPADAHRRCLEAQVMDWSDDVAYSVHDVEDGAFGGLIDLTRLADPTEQEAVCAVATDLYLREPVSGLDRVLVELLALPVLQAVGTFGPDAGSSRGGQRALKRAASELLGRFSAAAVAATRQRYGDGPLARYAADLVVPGRIQAECALLKATAYRYVMQRDGAAELQAHQRDVLCELVTVLCDRHEELDEPHAEAYATAADDAGRLRAVIDQVASLTDPSALQWHWRLGGGSG